MKYQINLAQVPNGSGSFDLDGVAFDFTWRTLRDGSLVCDIAVDGETIEGGRACVDRSPLLLICPFPSGRGNLYFADKFGNDDPVYTGVNDRFALVYDDAYDFESV